MASETQRPRWTILFRLPGGHKYFRDNRDGRVGVCDDSGKDPDQAEDGPLWLVPGETVRFGQSAAVRVTDREGKVSTVVECAENGLELAYRLGLSINFHDKDTTLGGPAGSGETPGEDGEGVVQVIVTCDAICGDPLKAALQHLKAAILHHYAKEFGAEAETHYSEHWTYHVVEFRAADRNALSFIHKLALAGCVDIHVDTHDDLTKDLIESAHGSLFRVCRTKDRFKR